MLGGSNGSDSGDGGDDDSDSSNKYCFLSVNGVAVHG